MKTTSYFFAAILALFVYCGSLQAQVTIGSSLPPQDFSILELVSTDRGLRLPRLTTVQRNDIDASGNDLANGLVIYNITTNCTEYWNGTKWVSLCTGTADITFDGGNPMEPSFPAAGDDRGSFTPHDSPDCTEQDPAFTFTVVSGSDYMYVTVLNETTGEFRVTMEENPTALARTAILRITNNCTREYKEFLFTQEAATGLCDPGKDAPVIDSRNGTSLCGKGAVYLYLLPPAGTTPTGYVWSRNGQEVARDAANYIATQPGIYKVYAGAIGCDAPSPSASVTVTAGPGVAPDPVTVIVGQNNGFVCDLTGKVAIYATATSAGTIVWYKDGEKQPDTGSPIDAGIGTWFAVVESAGCSSMPSNEVIVQLDPNGGTQIASPTFKINGTAVGSTVDVCANGTLLLDVETPMVGITYTWYVNNDLKSSGVHYELAMAGLNSDFVLQCRATGISQCSSAGLTQVHISQNDAPARPALSINNPGNVLCGGFATLTTTTVADAYRWYKDGAWIGTTASNVRSVTELGTYTLRVIEEKSPSDSCASEMSLPLVISQSSAYGTVTISPQIASLNEGEMRTFTADMNPEDVTTTYTWTITNATPASATGKSVLVAFGTHSVAATISVTATNACTPGGATAATSVNVLENCLATAVSPSGYVPSSKTAEIIGSTSKSLTVAPAEGNIGDYNYQWYKNDVEIPGAILRTYSATAAGSYTCKITSHCDGATATSDPFTVTHTTIPITPGAGTLSGRTVFDVASTVNSNSACGNIEGRYKSDFSQTFSNTQVYTFAKSGGTVQNVRYAIEDNEGVLQTSQSLSGTLESGTMSVASLPLTLKFKTNLNESGASPNIVGRIYDQAAFVKVNIIYVNGVQDVTVSKTLRIQDCNCCRAKINNSDYKMFMCQSGSRTPSSHPSHRTSDRRPPGCAPAIDLTRAPTTMLYRALWHHALPRCIFARRPPRLWNIGSFDEAFLHVDLGFCERASPHWTTGARSSPPLPRVRRMVKMGGCPRPSAAQPTWKGRP